MIESLTQYEVAWKVLETLAAWRKQRGRYPPVEVYIC